MNSIDFQINLNVQVQVPYNRPMQISVSLGQPQLVQQEELQRRQLAQQEELQRRQLAQQEELQRRQLAQELQRRQLAQREELRRHQLAQQEHRRRQLLMRELEDDNWLNVLHNAREFAQKTKFEEPEVNWTEEGF